MAGPPDSALAWLAARPNFELRPPGEQARMSLPLARPRGLVEALGRPDRTYRIVLVAGTKGKGSTSVMLASLLRAHHEQVGLYTQPHLHRLNERLRLNGQPIATAELEALLGRLRPIVERLDAAQPDLGPLTAYEIVTAVGLLWFAERAASLVVLEVGLGGRLDATNLVEPELSVITSISYDHTHILGSTLGAIAREKAGIMRPGRPTLSGPQRPTTMAALRAAARGADATLLALDERPELPRLTGLAARSLGPGDSPTEPLLRLELRSARARYPDLALHLGGLHQVDNARLALAGLELLRPADPPELAAVRSGLAEARWPGRLEIAATRPLLVLDGAHNGDSAARLATALRLHFRFERLHLVLGVFADKHLSAILRAFPTEAVIYATQTEHPRARPAAEVATTARLLGCQVGGCAPLAAALPAALAAAGPDDLVCVTGSLELVGVARARLGLAGS